MSNKIFLQQQNIDVPQKISAYRKNTVQTSRIQVYVSLHIKAFDLQFMLSV